MAITVSDISRGEANQVVAIEEGHFADVKSVDLAPKKIIKHLLAFANADGGELYIGIDDKPRLWRGFENQEAANGHIQAYDGVFHLSDDAEYEFLRCADLQGLVLKISIRKTQGVLRGADGHVYARRNAASNLVDNPDALRVLEFAKGETSFESTASRASIDRIFQSETFDRFIKHVVPHQEKVRFLKKQALVQKGFVTVAGCLLFDDMPQAILPSRSSVKIYRYKTTEAEGHREVLAFDPIPIEGCAYELIRETVIQTTHQVELIGRMGESGLESISYPPEALHEIVANAVLHRDYSIADDVHVRIFDNRIEVESPGRLPAHITPENILNERFVRNGNLFRLISMFQDPPNKGVGEGLNTAFRAMQALKLKDPLIIQRENTVLVTLRHEPLASPEQMIIDYLETHETVQNKTARELCHITEDWKVKSIFERMTKARLIEKVPGTDRSTTAYRKPRNIDDTTGPPPEFLFNTE